MMTSVFQLWKEKKEQGHKFIFPYIMAGDGGLDTTLQHIQRLEMLGVDAIELGIPFSDPVADGPVIQQAGERALERGTTFLQVLQFLKANRDTISVPIILMTYYNPILALGWERTVQLLKDTAVVGFIIPDLPYVEGEEERQLLAENGYSLFPLLSLTTPKHRREYITGNSEGFLYYVSMKGITGAKLGETHFTELKQQIGLLREELEIPVMIGFGISSPNDIEQVLQWSDGVIIGSCIIQLLQENKWDTIAALIQAVKQQSKHVHS